MRHKFEKIPVGLSGVALGTATLGLAWKNQGINWISYLTVTVALIYFFVLVWRDLKHPKIFKSELQHHVLGSYVPTLAMAMMVFAGMSLPIFPSFAKGLWIFAIGLHLWCLGVFLYHRFQRFDWEEMVPSWFVPPIGIVVACVNSKGMGFDTLAQWIWYIAAPLYLIMLVFMIYRLTFYNFKHPETFGIMAAPASLVFAGYLVISPEPNDLICHGFLLLSLLMTGVLYLAFFKLLKRDFNPGFAAFTFPLAIGAVALEKYSAALTLQNELQLAHVIQWVARIELVVATAIISYVVYGFYKYCKHEVFEFPKRLRKFSLTQSL